MTASLCYTTENGAPAQIAVISLGGRFVLGTDMLKVDERIVKESGPSAAIAIAWLEKNFEPHSKIASLSTVFKRLEDETGIHVPYYFYHTQVNAGDEK